MGFVLQLSDGITTVDFLAGDKFALEDGGLVIGNPEKVQTWTDVQVYGGSRLVSNRRGNREAEITFKVRSTTRRGLRTNLNEIASILNNAIAYGLGQGEHRVSLAYSWDDTGGVTYFEVLDGEIEEPENIMSVEQMHGKVDGKYVISNVVLHLTLSPDVFGVPPSQGDQMIEVPLRNPNSSEGGTGYDLGGIYVADYQDNRITLSKKHVNWVDIRGTDVEGDSPALAKIIIGENSGVDCCTRFAIGHTRNMQFKHQFNAVGDADMVAHLGNPQTLSHEYAVNGQYVRLTLNNSIFEQKIISLTLNDPSQYGGDYYRLALHAPTVLFLPVNVLYRAKVYTGLNTAPLYTTEWVGASLYSSFVDFGPIPVPPFSKRMPKSDKLYIGIYVLSDTSSGSFELNYDYALLLPVSDGYRSIISRVPQENLGTYPTIVDDGWNDVAYASTHADPSNPSALAAGLVSCRFTPITLLPGVNQRLYFFPSGYPGSNFLQAPDDFYRIRVFYSPTYGGV